MTCNCEAAEVYLYKLVNRTMHHVSGITVRIHVTMVVHQFLIGHNLILSSGDHVTTT